MFEGCSSLIDINPLEKWNVSKCSDFRAMFHDCLSLSYMKPLEIWDVSKTSKVINMFLGCLSLTEEEFIHLKFK